MPESVTRRDLLYETALSIGMGPDLRGLLLAFLPGLARRFSCTLASVVRSDVSAEDSGLFRTEHIVPRSLAQS